MAARARVLIALIGIAGCAAPETVSVSDEALTCDLGSSDALEQACTRAATPTPIMAAPLTSTSPPAIADSRAYGVRLVAVSGGYQGLVAFTPTQTTTYEIYASSPNAGVRVLVPNGGTATMVAGCTSAITSAECSSLRRVDSYSLVAGQTYRIAIGTTTVSYIRLYLQARDPEPPVCAAGELSEVTAACTDASAGDEQITLDPIGGNQAQNISLDHVYGMRLPSAGGTAFGGMFAFAPPVDGDYELYLGTPNIPLQVTDFFAHTPIEMTCTRYIPASECAKLRRGDRFTLHASIDYRFDLGPIANNNYVRVTIRRVAPTTNLKLGPPTTYPTDFMPNHLNHGDLDGEGDIDIVAPVADDAGGTIQIELLRNNGHGNFTTANKVVWSVPGQNVVSDFNSDGILDILGNSWDGQGPLNGYYMVGDGSFQYTTTPWGNARDYLPYISGGDFNEDGTLDVVAPFVDSTSNTGPSGFVITLMPSFTVAQTQLAFGNSTRQAVAGDFNGDGHQDVVVSSDTQAQLFLGDGSGQVTASGAPFAIAGRELYAADVNNDGSVDLVAVAGTAIYYGSPTGFSAPQPLATGLTFARGAAIGDFDHDGFIDLAITGSDTATTGAVAVFLGSATGLTGPTMLPVPDTTAATDPTVADFNGDGFSDLAVATQGGVTVFLSTP